MGDLKGPAKVDWIGLKAAAIILGSVNAAATQAASSLPEYQQKRFIVRVNQRAYRERWLADPLTDKAKHAAVNRPVETLRQSVTIPPQHQEHSDIINDGIRDVLDRAKCNELSKPVEAALTGQEIITGTALSRQEKLAYLGKIVRTPLSEVSKESILCQEHTETDDGKGGGSTKIKMPDKLRAIALSARLQGELAGDQAVTVNIFQDEQMADAIEI